jgi:hypothetical protein
VVVDATLIGFRSLRRVTSGIVNFATGDAQSLVNGGEVYNILYIIEENLCF